MTNSRFLVRMGAMKTDNIYQLEAYQFISKSRVLEDGKVVITLAKKSSFLTIKMLLVILSLGMFSLAAAVIYLFYLRSKDVMATGNVKATHETRMGISALNITETEWLEQSLPSPIPSQHSSISSLTRSVSKLVLQQQYFTNHSPDVKCPSNQMFCDIDQVLVKQTASDKCERNEVTVVCNSDKSEYLCDDIEGGRTSTNSPSMKGDRFDTTPSIVHMDIAHNSSDISNLDEGARKDMICESGASLRILQEI